MSARTTIKELHHDQRGAIMVMGLCMACFLIGSLWFLIGIGDAIVFRDTMQEATDHATFTSAALHAKGMNFISACNMLMLALISVHIIMGLIHDILLAVCIISLGTVCEPWTQWRKVYFQYAKVFKPIAAGLHVAEMVAAYSYPLLAAYKGYTTGLDYAEFGPKKHKISMFVVSPSLVTGDSLVEALDTAFDRMGMNRVKTPPVKKAGDKNAKAGGDTEGYGGVKGLKGNDVDNMFGADKRASDKKPAGPKAGSKMALPVENGKYSDVCEYFAAKDIDSLLSLAGKAGGGPAVDMVKTLLGGAIKPRYCNGSAAASAVADIVKQGSDAIDAENARRALNGLPSIEKPMMGDGGGGGSGGKVGGKGGLGGMGGMGGGVGGVGGGPGAGAGGGSAGGGNVGGGGIGGGIGGGGSGGGGIGGGGGGGGSGSGSGGEDNGSLGTCWKDNSTIDPGVDKWWNCDGPLVPWGKTQNGSPWNQVWGINFRPSFRDAQEHRVAIAERRSGDTSTAVSNTYFAEAEFYFDCTKGWTDIRCNLDDNAAYSVQWRARLKRFQSVEVTTLITSFAGAFLSQLSIYKAFKDKISGMMKSVDPRGKVLPSGEGGNPLISGNFDGLTNGIVDKAKQGAQGSVPGARPAVPRALNPLGYYH